MQINISSQEDIKQLILDIEQKWPVDKWIINEIHVWPYIRIKIYTHFLSKLFAVGSAENTATQSHIGSKDFIVKKYINQVIEFVKSIVLLNFFFLKLKKKKIIFFGAHYHRILYRDEYFNRFYDSMVEEHNLEDEVYTIEYRRVNKENFNNKAIINLDQYLGLYKRVVKVFNRLKTRKDIYSLEGFEEFYEYVDLKNLGLEKKQLLNWSNKINSAKGFFDIIYKKVKPEKIIFLGYYGLDDLTAAIVAANKIDLNTVDLQHGSQINNMAFGDWTKIPKGGFNTVVKEFWTWDEESKKNIDLWAGEVSVIKTKTIGQPYVSYWVNKKSQNEEFQKKILYTLHLSNIEEMLTPEIILLIKSLQYQWVLRLHPRTSTSMEEIEKFLLSNGIKDKVILQTAIEKPLPEMLSESILHITNYSGSLIEARMMAIPSLIINKLGLEIYKQYLDEDLVFFIDFEKPEFVSKCQNLMENLENKEKIAPKLQVFNPLTY